MVELNPAPQQISQAALENSSFQTCLRAITLMTASMLAPGCAIPSDAEIEAEIDRRVTREVAQLELKFEQQSAAAAQLEVRELWESLAPDLRKNAAESVQQVIDKSVNEHLVSGREDLVRNVVDALQGRTDINHKIRALSESSVPEHEMDLALCHHSIACTVQLNGTDTVGSGTIVRSGHNLLTGLNETLIFTSYHVIRNILADTPAAAADGLAITIYSGDNRVEVRGDMIARNERIDAALVRLRAYDETVPYKQILTAAEARGLRVWDRIIAVGCPIGSDPCPTAGEITLLKNQINGANYWQISSPGYFGNSGGGVYVRESGKLIGIFSKIYTHGRGNPVVIPHMCLLTPPPELHRWLAQEGLEVDRNGDLRWAAENAAVAGAVKAVLNEAVKLIPKFSRSLIALWDTTNEELTAQAPNPVTTLK